MSFRGYSCITKKSFSDQSGFVYRYPSKFSEMKRNDLFQQNFPYFYSKKMQKITFIS